MTPLMSLEKNINILPGHAFKITTANVHISSLTTAKNFHMVVQEFMRLDFNKTINFLKYEESRKSSYIRLHIPKVRLSIGFFRLRHPQWRCAFFGISNGSVSYRKNLSFF
jgi:hypothetical protein